MGFAPDVTLSALAAYPYLSAALFWTVLSRACIARHRDLRGPLLLSGAAAVPFGLLSFLFIPDYWNPRVIAWFGAGSPEDLLFSFASGVISLSLVCQLQRPAPIVDYGRFLPRYLACTAFGASLGIALRHGMLDLPVMQSFIVTSLVLGCLLGWAWRFWLRAVIAGAGLFLFAYGSSFLAVVGWWPGFERAWHSTGIHAVWIAGIPAYELAWALCYGVTWPLLMLSCLGARPADHASIASVLPARRSPP